MAAVSTSVHPWLVGPVRPARVLATPRSAAHLLLAEPDGSDAATVIALLGPGAVRLPIGVALGPGEAHLLDRLQVGQPAAVGAGRIELAGQVLRAGRWWDPRSADPVAGFVPEPGVVERLAGLLTELPDDLLGPADRLGAALGRAHRADDLALAVAALVGRGPGLTPAGDDLLAGALVASARGPAHPPLVAAVRSLLPRTTALSAALLDQACAGATLPQVRDLLRACRGVAGPTGLAEAVAALCRVGASSGAALGHGVRVALVATARRSGQVAA